MFGQTSGKERLVRTVLSSADGEHMLVNNIHATCRCHYVLMILLSAVTYSFPSIPPTSELQEWIFEEMLNFCFLNRALKGEASWNVKYKIAKQAISEKQTDRQMYTYTHTHTYTKKSAFNGRKLYLPPMFHQSFE